MSSSLVALDSDWRETSSHTHRPEAPDMCLCNLWCTGRQRPILWSKLLTSRQVQPPYRLGSRISFVTSLVLSLTSIFINYCIYMLRIDKYQNDDRSKFFRSVSLLYEFQLTGAKVVAGQGGRARARIKCGSGGIMAAFGMASRAPR
jgi:hypothetical protein